MTASLHAVEPLEPDERELVQSFRPRSRRRPWRDGLATQTVAENIEDAKCYRAFERAIIDSFVPRSVIELELVHRLASLLWRLRRASAIETGLFQIQNERTAVHSYLRLAKIDSALLDQLSGYEASCGARPRKRCGYWTRCDGRRRWPRDALPGWRRFLSGTVTGNNIFQIDANRATALP
jgi:hypothetical protein